MIDTPPDVARRYHEMLMARSGAARLFLRFYGRDFSPQQRAAIVEKIRARSDERIRSSSAR